jgi:hypothetical protein
MARKEQEVTKIPQNAKCLNCQYSPTILCHDGNPWIAYCEVDGKREPQVARQNCCKKWKPATQVKKIIKP